MPVPVRCRNCGDVVGIYYGFSRYLPKSRFNRNAPCKGTHGKPSKIIRKGMFLNSVTVSHVDGSSSRYKTFKLPSSKPWRVIARTFLWIYVNIFRCRVYDEDKEDWVFPMSFV